MFLRKTCRCLKFSYIFNVDKNDGNGAKGNEKFVLGLQKFSPCPGQKKRYQEIGKRELINHQTLTIKNYYILTAT